MNKLGKLVFAASVVVAFAASAQDLTNIQAKAPNSAYVQDARGVIARDPFVSLDTDSVGELIRIAAERGRKTREKLKLGICSEHGGDPDSVRFCHDSGLDYVSCSPFRVPIARLVAAQAALQKSRIDV